MAAAKKFTMRRKPSKPQTNYKTSTYIYSGQRLKDIIEIAKQNYGDLWPEAQLGVDLVDDYSDGCYANACLYGDTIPTAEVMAKYEAELAEYNQWLKDNAAEIKALKEAEKEKKRIKEIKQLAEQEAHLQKQLELINKAKEKLGI
jgi:hypothetical protein